MKLSLDALKERAEATASNELLAAITGGNENSCHDATPAAPAPSTSVKYKIDWKVTYDKNGWGGSVGGSIEF